MSIDLNCNGIGCGSIFRSHCPTLETSRKNAIDYGWLMMSHNNSIIYCPHCRSVPQPVFVPQTKQDPISVQDFARRLADLIRTDRCCWPKSWMDGVENNILRAAGVLDDTRSKNV